MQTNPEALQSERLKLYFGAAMRQESAFAWRETIRIAHLRGEITEQEAFALSVVDSTREAWERASLDIRHQKLERLELQRLGENNIGAADRARTQLEQRWIQILRAALIQDGQHRAARLLSADPALYFDVTLSGQESLSGPCGPVTLPNASNLTLEVA